MPPEMEASGPVGGTITSPTDRTVPAPAACRGVGDLEFVRWFDFAGLQRHLKVAGIFARLTLRDGKPQYLADTPRFIAYIRATCSRYMALKPLLRLVETIEGIEIPTAFAFGRF